MSYSVQLSFRGLSITANLDDYVPATREQPEEGGGCMEFEWEVEDIDEVLEHLAIPEGAIRDRCSGFYNRFSRLPVTLHDRIEDGWNDAISEAATEHFWGTVGGPSGYQDYNYDG